MIGAALLVAATGHTTRASEPVIAPSRMTAIGAVDARFQSYNAEMVEVTGGRFWKPYAQGHMEHDRYSDRPPIDLADVRLRKLAAALSPAYMRISGTWANAACFDDSDALAAPPAGFNTVLSRAQWRGVIDFARATDAGIVTSFAVSPGSRGADGIWAPDGAQRLIDATHALGGASPPPSS
jgi:hypothetical protein